jgi:hypothetical protein
MGSVNAAEIILGKHILEPVQYFGHHQWPFIAEINFAVIAAGLYPDDIFFPYRFGALVGRNGQLFHIFLFFWFAVPAMPFCAEQGILFPCGPILLQR